MLLEDSALTKLLSLVILGLLLFVMNKKKQMNFKYVLIFILMYFYCVEVFYITILPLPLDAAGVESLSLFRTGNYINIIPFIDFANYDLYSFVRQVIGNIILFIPFGLLFPFLSNNINIKEISIKSFELSLIIESVQLLISFFIIKAPFKIFDVNDLILNTLGGIIGYILYKGLNLLLEKDTYNKKMKNTI